MRRTVLAAAMLASTSMLVHAQSNLEKLSNFKTTGTKEFTVIEQGGDKADAIKAILEKIKLPDGFSIDLYAIVPDARHMAVGTQGIVTFVGTRKTKIWAVTDRDKDRVADEVKDFAPSIDFAVPNGPCFSPEGVLYVAEQNRILSFPAAEFFYEGPDVAAFNVLKQGDLIPEDEVSYNHTARVCRIGPDGKLYVSLGQPFNVPAPEKAELYGEHGIGGIIRINQDGTGREVYARGVRNSVGHDFNPANGELWFTDNQVDGMGDDTPPGEINRQTTAGQHFGFPWYGGGSVRTVPGTARCRLARASCSRRSMRTAPPERRKSSPKAGWTETANISADLSISPSCVTARSSSLTTSWAPSIAFPTATDPRYGGCGMPQPPLPG